jgi:hypothetical protein
MNMLAHQDPEPTDAVTQLIADGILLVLVLDATG